MLPWFTWRDRIWAIVSFPGLLLALLYLVARDAYRHRTARYRVLENAPTPAAKAWQDSVARGTPIGSDHDR